MFREIWEEQREAVKAILGDAFRFAFALAILTGLYLYLQLLPYPPERKEIFDALHFYAFLIIIVIFLYDLVWKIFISFFGGQE